jgi:serine/threonine protein kinase
LGIVLGQGGFAVVREAVHKQTHQRVAVKIFEKRGLEQKDLNDLQREIAISQRLRHPHLIQLIDVYETETHVYLVLEK